jgi:hypothetical protein
MFFVDALAWSVMNPQNLFPENSQLVNVPFATMLGEVQTAFGGSSSASNPLAIADTIRPIPL